MARKLPWLTGRTSSKRPNAPPSASPAKRRRLAGPNESSEVRPTRRPDQLKYDSRTRTPSSSPPPQIPTQTPMKPSDRVWIMVEDEFYATAQLFTRHLHHAEYKRLQDLASKKSDVALAAIERPTRGQKQNIVTKAARAQQGHTRRAAEAIDETHKRDIRKGQRSGETSSGSEEELAIGDRNLAQLLQGNTGRTAQRQKPILTSPGGRAKPNTRAAAGFGRQDMRPKSRGEAILYDVKDVKSTMQDDTRLPLKSNIGGDEDFDSEDLDAPARSTKASLGKDRSHIAISPVPHPPLSLQEKRIDRQQQHSVPSREMPETEASSQRAQRPSLTTAQKRPNEIIKPSVTQSLPLPRTAASGFTKKATAKDNARKDKEKRPIQLDEIPTFLF